MTTKTARASKKKSEQDVRGKRLKTLAGVYELMEKYRPLVDNTRFDHNMAARAVEDYIIQWNVLKKRDNIRGRIQRHKIAGLMAASIVKFRPLMNHFRDDFDGLDALGNSEHNEKFAIYHGVAICAEGCPDDRFIVLLNDPLFKTWVEAFIALFRKGTPCRDSLIHIFGTLCLGFFPESLRHPAKSQ